MFPLFKDKTVKIRFLIDRSTLNKRMSWDDLETIEMMREGESSPRRLKTLAAHFMADDAGNYLPEDKALKILGSLTGDEISDTLKKFTDALQESAVSPQSGSASNSLLRVGSEGALPDGQQL